MTIRIGRGGARSDGGGYWVAKGNAYLTHSHGEVTIKFQSGGTSRATDWTVFIGQSSFGELAKLMVALAPKTAIKAFGMALSEAELD